MSTADKPERTIISKKGWKAADYQAQQLEKLLKDPTKAVFIPEAPAEKKLRAPQEMMKNVQGSSAGAGSGEFHVYKQSRRREYERLAEMDREEAKVSFLPFEGPHAHKVLAARSRKVLSAESSRRPSGSGCETGQESGEAESQKGEPQ
jgi:hypothetical protein